MKQTNKQFSSEQPIIGQILNFIPSEIFEKAQEVTQSDKYYKKLSSKIHFITLFYATLTKNSSLREVCKNIILLADKLIEFGFSYLPCRSTLSDANKNRSSVYFETIYKLLHEHYKESLVNFSLPIGGEVLAEKVEIFDSTTISLFKEILKGVGRNPITGKKKGGIKAFTKINLADKIPNFVSFKAASTNETTFLKTVELVEDSIAVFDKGFIKFQFFAELTTKGIWFVTRKKKNMSYEVIKSLEVDAGLGIIKDEIIKVSYKENKELKTADFRLITYQNPIDNKILEFLTNIEHYNAFTISLLYKNRWVIEVLFKQLKQNFELKYFLSDNENGIKSQIWMALILNLLFTVIHKITKEIESFSTLVQIATKNLGVNISIIQFIEQPFAIHKELFFEKLRKVQFDKKQNTQFDKT